MEMVFFQWTWSDSNRRPPQCECGALPTALQAHNDIFLTSLLSHHGGQMSRFSMGKMKKSYRTATTLSRPAKGFQGFLTQIVTIQYLHSYTQKSIPDQLRWWDFCPPAYVFLRSAQQVRRPTEQLQILDF